MAVIILNITDHDEENDNWYGQGKQTYSLRINHRELCQFTHLYEEGLAQCLREAAEAFEEMEKKKDGKINYID